MLVLGWHGGVTSGEGDMPGGYSMHDGAAVLLRDGAVVAAIEEERLDRVKHSNAFPAQSIRFCLQRAGVTLDDVDFIALDAQESVLDEFVTFCALINPDQRLVTGRQWLTELFERQFAADVSSKLRFCGHHMAHTYGAIYASGQTRGLAVSLDGEGDHRSGLVSTFDGDSITPLVEYSPAQSLGEFYTSAIALLGYRRFDEYKVMGLAPYGDASKYASLFEQFYSLHPDGSFEIAPDGVKLGLIAGHGLLQHVRRKGEPFTQVHKDLAASIQDMLERIGLHLFRHFRTQTGMRSVCFSGGVAHNCTLNGKLLYSGLFDEVFVQPVAHDAGNALGAAMATTLHEGGRPASRTIPHLYLGSGIGGDSEIESRLTAWGELVTFERCSDIAGTTADLLASQHVVGWVQGESEFGPRALGNRSILADARPAEFKERINAMVKKREGYRPFAPSVIEERLHDFFDVPAHVRELPFMIFVVRVREEMREMLGAVTHVDGTARVQTVSRSTNPRYHALIEAFGRRTGVPVLLNTSFNNDAEPIVDSVDDAVACYLTTRISHLVVGDHLISRIGGQAVSPVLLRSLVPTLRPHQKLVKKGDAYVIESTTSSFFGPPRLQISSDMFRMLCAPSPGSVADRCATAGIHDERALSSLSAELEELWSRRAVTLRP
ncbi:MAG TPA: carbamoyltransferase C-terminal domain-containing protein [Vicinamibacterales bacterium]